MPALLALIPARWLIGAGVAVAVLLLAVAGVFHYRNSIIAAERARQEQANERSQEQARVGEIPLADCVSRGRTWDRVNGVCLAP